ncbi:16S rRNA (guanine(966)-N(2))-methyltransferase RsmD [Corynebacterium uropygiale]|uniref:16S rRNA (Guanine(966)-N(2))-methyltransferase RsmD n=1 Tax=Corynebacterium uropygiale TaxID=1775911 RepID=A0A9X1QQ03_9CORY|nr:16S rRNA (guanine(966)-N(2))-methyltransferase RsmD [Corynebacterium uropygiale]MCF4007031.1 16S rRNA (guanine(966)-N(2))-methyltransferase RsmD [Corynebacterium uropygiale]
MSQPRIISGIARGRKLKVPPEGTRPTSDRAKEGLFSSLQVRFGFEGRTVLDLFAGTGALGLEALSRGAQEVVLVENQRQALAVIRSNVEKVGLPGATVVEQQASSYVATAPRRHFDLVLADPPYDLSTETVEEILRALEPLLADEAMVVIERHVDSREPEWPEGYEPTNQKLKKRTYGIARMDMAFFHREEKE